MSYRPYIGVSGVMTAEEAATLVQVYENLCERALGSVMPTHDLMLGALVSEKTLRGETNRWPRRYAKVGEIQAIFDAAWASAREDRPVTSDAPPTDKPLNLIHYASDVPPTLETIQQLFGLGLASLGGFQFNVTWPSPETLEAFAESMNDQAFRRLRVVLQVGPAMLAQKSLRDITDDIGTYFTGAVATDLLVDVSGGRGKLIDLHGTTETVRTLQTFCDRGYRIGIAGGLSAESLTDGIGMLMKGSSAWPNGVSIDAEGRLRDGADGGGNLDMEKATAYLRRAVDLSIPPKDQA